MSDSVSSPWVRNYLVDVAEIFGAQLYNAPPSPSKKKVQLTDFLTYQENSYVWAWMSDKDYRVSVRISKDAVDQYKSRHGRNIFDCRFSVILISGYRPMFSPRPLGPNTTGNTPIAHISLEVAEVKLIGIGGHLFGNPRDLESDENIREWVLGLRQDGGGGNVLKLRKEEALAQRKKAPPSPPSSPPFSLYAPVTQCQVVESAENVAKSKSERVEDLKRAYTKRWRTYEAHPWKLVAKQVVLDLCPSPPPRTPSPTSGPRRQGTPTDWSPSNRGSPVAPDEDTPVAPRDGIRQHSESADLPIMSSLPSDTEGHATVDTVITSDTHCQLPTPAQRIRRSPSLPNSPFRSSPDVSARSSPLPCQQPSSFPPPPSSPLALPSSSLPLPTSIRKNIQRKVPHPGSPVPPPDPTKLGPVQILVPNSDTSATGSSQSFSQSQQYGHQLLSHSPAFPSSLTKDFEPPDTSTPKEGNPSSSTRHASKVFAEFIATHFDIGENEIILSDDKGTADKAGIKERAELELARPPALSVPKIEVLEVATSDPEEEDDQLHNTARTEADFDMQAGTKGIDEGKVSVDHGDDQQSVDKVEGHPAPQTGPPHQLSFLTVPSVMQRTSPNGQDTKYIRSQSSMHSLFSDLLEDEGTVSSHTPTAVDRTGPNTQEEATTAAHVLTHDPEAWKEPSFLARNKEKGKARAVEEPDTPSIKAGKKRRRSGQPESPAPKRAKVATPEKHRKASSEAIRPPDIVAPTSVAGKTSSDSRHSATPANADTTPSKPRLANFAVNFGRLDLGKRVPIPMVNLSRNMRSTLLRTGRIRTLGEEVERDGSAYIMR